MLNFFKRLKYKDINNVWYNSHVYDRNNYPVIFDKEGNYIDCKIGQKLIMGKTDSGKNIYYEVVGYYRERPWADWLYPSDAIRCKMKFSHIEN